GHGGLRGGEVRAGGADRGAGRGRPRPGHSRQRRQPRFGGHAHAHLERRAGGPGAPARAGCLGGRLAGPEGLGAAVRGQPPPRHPVGHLSPDPSRASGEGSHPLAPYGWPKTSCASRTISSSFLRSASGLMALPSSEVANPHWVPTARRSTPTKRLAALTRETSASKASRSGFL